MQIFLNTGIALNLTEKFLVWMPTEASSPTSTNQGLYNGRGSLANFFRRRD